MRIIDYVTETQRWLLIPTRVMSSRNFPSGSKISTQLLLSQPNNTDIDALQRGEPTLVPLSVTSTWYLSFAPKLVNHNPLPGWSGF